MEPTEAQYLVINALQTLDLVLNSVYDEDTGIWYIETPSPVLSLACLMPDGEIQPVELPANDE
jgi:hypothetical protein